MTSADATTQDWIRIVRSEYLEMPGLRLTQSQARRLWGLDERACTSMLEQLVKESFLSVSPDGRYTLAASDQAPIIAAVASADAFRVHAIVHRINSKAGS